MSGKLSNYVESSQFFLGIQFSFELQPNVLYKFRTKTTRNKIIHFCSAVLLVSPFFSSSKVSYTA